VHFESIIDILRRRAQDEPDAVLYRFLDDGGKEVERVSYGQLEERARAVAATLQDMGMRGERCLLVYPPGLELTIGFYGCLFAGAVAVPVYPPDPGRLARTLPRLEAVARDARARAALSTAAIVAIGRGALGTMSEELRSITWLATDTIARAGATAWTPIVPGAGDTAFLQYTSGSTAQPRGVIVTHGNLIHNEQLIEHAFGHTRQSIGVGWLPLYHDMGLIGNVIQPLHAGFPCVLMSPMSFLRRPAVWLHAISEYRATTSGGPNFAFDLCVRKIAPEERSRMDLRSWQVAFNGAEPVRSETMRRFADAFAPAGFSERAFYPCYGLAEATLIATGGSSGALPVARQVDAQALARDRLHEPADARARQLTLVSSGRVLGHQDLAIVAPDTRRECDPDQVGEIWLAGPSIAAGYWGQPEATAETFGARIGGSPRGPFLRTGDLGAVRDGELFVTGRLKDLLILRGKNHYPQDIEQAVERCHAAVRRGGAAAFAVEAEHGDDLVVMAEIDARAAGEQERQDIVRAIRDAIAAEHDLQPAAVALIAAGALPKTSSGKIQRHACKASYRGGALDALIHWRMAEAGPETTEAPAAENAAENAAGDTAGLAAPPAPAPDCGIDEIAAWLGLRIAQLLRIPGERIDLRTPLARYGLDSLAVMTLLGEIEEVFAARLTLAALFDARGIEDLAGAIATARRAGPAETSHPIAARPERVEAQRRRPLSSAQRRLWVLDRLCPGDAAYHLPVAIRLRGPVDLAALDRSIQRVVQRHEGLRCVFLDEGGEPYQEVRADQPVPFAIQDLRALPDHPAEQRETLLQEALRAEARRPFDLRTGPLVRALVVRLAADELVVLLTFHHIVFDGWSVAPLSRELTALYQSERTGAPIALAPLALQVGDIAALAQQDAPRLDEQLAYWVAQLDGCPPLLELPSDRARRGDGTYRRGSRYPLHVPRALVAQLAALGHRHDATLFMTMLAAFNAFLYRQCNRQDIVVGAPTAGRTRAGMAPLIGFFVNTLVFRTQVTGSMTIGDVVTRTRDVCLGAYANQDVPFEVLVEKLSPARELGHTPLVQTLLVLQPQPPLPRFEGVEVSRQPVHAGGCQFDLVLELTETAAGLEGWFELDLDLFSPETIARLAGEWLRFLAAFAAGPERRVAELPVLDPADLHRIVHDWNRHGEEFRTERLVHEWFEHTVEDHPDALACARGAEHLTYGQLDDRANRLSRVIMGLIACSKT
jgi:acyl-CoA synthetase (AMP-forming)/AMP-acid ligase II/acyl carrier protein